MTLKDTTLTALYKKFYPVGSYYFSNNNTKTPSQLFGGSWIQVIDKFLFTSSSSPIEKNNSTTQTLPTSILQSHYHSYQHDHSGISHSHSVSSTSHPHSISGHSHSGSSTASHNHSSRNMNIYNAEHIQGPLSAAGMVGSYTVYTINAAREWCGDSEISDSISSLTKSLGSLTASGNGSVTGGSGSTNSASMSFSLSNTGSNSSFSIMPSYKGFYAWYKISDDDEN